MQNKIIMAGLVGNLIESFDMAICGLLSVYFAKYLIGDINDGLALVLLTFLAGHLARPVGAIVLGLFSDTYGRKIILAISVLSMGVSTALIGFIPPNEIIGKWAICFLIILRFLQSFFCGAEYLNSSAYLVESADNSKKGYVGSWVPFGSMLGLLSASVTVLIVTNLINSHPELEWLIWRVPFVLALLGSSIGLYIRICTPESVEFLIYYSEKPKPKVREILKLSSSFLLQNKLQALYIFNLSALGVATTYQIYLYAPMQAHIYGFFTDAQIIVSNIFSLIVMLCVLPIIGRLSDRIDREKIIVAACLGFWFLSIPYFYFLSSNNFSLLLIFQILISIAAGTYYATVPVFLADMFPIHLRCTILSTLYATASSLAAGLTPLLSLILLKNTNLSFSPTLLIFILISIIWVLMRIRKLSVIRE